MRVLHVVVAGGVVWPRGGPGHPAPLVRPPWGGRARWATARGATEGGVLRHVRGPWGPTRRASWVPPDRLTRRSVREPRPGRAGVSPRCSPDSDPEEDVVAAVDGSGGRFVGRRRRPDGAGSAQPPARAPPVLRRPVRL